MAKKEKTPAPPDNESNGDSAETPAPAKGGKMKLIPIIVLAVLIGAGGAVGALKLLGGSDSGSAAPEAAKTEETAPAENAGPEAAPEGGEPTAGSEAIGPQNIEFKPFIVNLNDAGGKRYLKLSMSVEVDTEALGQEINSKMPMFRDTILLLLSSLSYDDISTLDGKMRLRSQMLNRINTQLTSGKIKNIYFAEFVVQ